MKNKLLLLSLLCASHASYSFSLKTALMPIGIIAAWEGFWAYCTQEKPIDVVASKQYQVTDQRVPIVYHPGYTASLGKKMDTLMRWMHPFDTKKYKKVHQYLIDQLGIKEGQLYMPSPVTNEQLLHVHDQAYLNSLNSSVTISRAVDLEEALGIIPNRILQKKLLDPMRLATGGTVLGAELALQHGWAINLSGGYHHAKPDRGEGGCMFADIPLAIRTLQKKKPGLKVLVIDLDAHQGNGVASYVGAIPNLFIFDMYNQNEYPVYKKNNYFPENKEDKANSIRFAHPLDGGQLVYTIGSIDVSQFDYLALTEHPESRSVNDEHYLGTLKKELPAALAQLKHEGKKPDLIIYNAGTDPYQKDNWGCLDVSEAGLIARDQFVWHQAKEQNIPILMVLSGGYHERSSHIIAESIEKILVDRGVLK